MDEPTNHTDDTPATERTPARIIEFVRTSKVQPSGATSPAPSVEALLTTVLRLALELARQGVHNERELIDIAQCARRAFVAMTLKTQDGQPIDLEAIGKSLDGRAELLSACGYLLDYIAELPPDSWAPLEQILKDGFPEFFQR